MLVNSVAKHSQIRKPLLHERCSTQCASYVSAGVRATEHVRLCGVRDLLRMRRGAWVRMRARVPVKFALVYHTASGESRRTWGRCRVLRRVQKFLALGVGKHHLKWGPQKAAQSGHPQ